MAPDNPKQTCDHQRTRHPTSRAGTKVVSKQLTNVTDCHFTPCALRRANQVRSIMLSPKIGMWHGSGSDATRKRDSQWLFLTAGAACRVQIYAGCISTILHGCGQLLHSIVCSLHRFAHGRQHLQSRPSSSTDNGGHVLSCKQRRCHVNI